MLHYAEIVRAGRVLSTSNRTALDAAIDALQEVQARDDESRNRPSSSEDEAKAAMSFLDLPLPRSILDMPLPHR